MWLNGDDIGLYSSLRLAGEWRWIDGCMLIRILYFYGL